MKSKLASLYYAVRSSFWFIPSVMAVFAMLAAPLLLRVDEAADLVELSRRIPGPTLTVEGARQILSTIAGAMITVASLVLSMTFVALTLLSQQLGPRILQVFMEDTTTKVTIGIFLATFVFAILTLGATGTGKEGEFVPLLTAYTAGALALVAFGVMINFINHIATSIQADVVISRLGDELNAAISSELARTKENVRWLQSDGADTHGALPEPDLTYFTLDRSGYIETIDELAALEFARNRNVHLQLLCRPGHYILRGIPVAALEPIEDSELSAGDGNDDSSNEDTKSGEEDDPIAREVQSLFTTGARRTRRQHVEFEIHALVEIALRALSPGINDPFTALTSIDRLTDGLSRILAREGSRRILVDDDGVCRVSFYPTPFEHYLDSAFFPIRQAAPGNTMVALKLLSALRSLTVHAQSDLDLKTIAEHADLVGEAFERASGIAHDLSQVKRRIALIRETVDYLSEALAHPSSTQQVHVPHD
jgi:uncharacterized membrane protein